MDANVMILFDNSGSMNAAVSHPDYDNEVVWSGNFTSDKTYYVGSDGSYRPSSFNSEWPGSPFVYLVNSDGGRSGRYLGNYLNWMYFHATDEQRSQVPAITMIQIAKIVVSDIISDSERVKIGLAKFNYDNGASIVAACGTPEATLLSAVNGLVADSWTPLGESMEDVLDYFADDGPGAPIGVECQHNFTIVITDGYPTKDLAVSGYLHDADNDGNDPGNCTSIGAWWYSSTNDCSDHMDDVAYWMRHNDLRPDLGEPGESWEDGQNVITYTIGFGIDADILADAAFNGDGLYFPADNAVELWSSLELILQEIVVRISSGAAVAVVSTERGDDDSLFRGKFMPGTWQGYLECFSLPYEEGDHSVWEAGTLLRNRSPSSREIIANANGNVIPFHEGHAGDLVGLMGVADVTEAEDLINWTRGEAVAGYRARNGWVLGDIIHSTPVVIGPPQAFTLDPGYQEFITHHENRLRTVFVGSNDGMLHAFDADTGQEMWAFIPEYALAQLNTIAAPNYCHSYSVDLPPAMTDVKIGGVWRTILVCGGREGGATYFALDVTYPESPQFLWETAMPDYLVFPSEVEFANIGGEALMLIGSGLDEVGGEAHIYAVELDSGAVVGSGAELANLGAGRNKATKPNAVDLDLNGETDVIYCGDMSGTLFRFEPNENADPSSWDRSDLFRDGANHPITAAPTVAFGEHNQVNVYFGTGAYLDTGDLTTTDQQYFYCIKDDHDGTCRTQWDLRGQTDVIHDMEDAAGWFIQLEEQIGERVTEPAVVVSGTTFFTSYAPTCEPCNAGGASWLYRLDYADGGIQDNEEGEDGDEERITALGAGVASRSVVDLANETVIVQSSDATITVEDLGTTIFHLIVRSWQETYDTSQGQSVTTTTPQD